MSHRILVCDDDETIRTTVAELLERSGHQVDQAADGTSALAMAGKHAYALILLDLRLPDMSGIDVLTRLHEADDQVLVVIMTAYPEVRTAVSALKAGAYDYLNKPFDLEDLRSLVRRALDTQRMRAEIERLRLSVAAPVALEGLIGESPAFTATIDVVRRIASAPRAPVLIRGETGTGKEGIAQAVHRLSPRSGGPWVALNCSAIAEGLLESEMFGHERGAFTDAKTGRRGLLELADGGTLFLDEVGDLSPALQPKLLRALETQSFRRVGGSREISVDVRFVAATNRDLEGMVRAGRFREDLYYRLNVAGIDVPPLRERKEDIPHLALHFVAEGARSMGMSVPALTPRVVGLLQRYGWPGNIRELRNVIERAILLAGGQSIEPRHLPKELLAWSGEDVTLAGAGNGGLSTLADIERAHIEHVLDALQGNKTQAARVLGITRLTLRNKIKQYDLARFQDEI